MKQVFIAITLLLFATNIHAQKEKSNKEKAPTQKELQDMMKDAQRMMDEAMKDMSPDEKKQVSDAMKNMQQMAKDGKMQQDKASAKLPEKQTAILSKIPKLTTASQYSNYLESLKTKASKTIDAAIVIRVEQLIKKLRSQPQALNNLAPVCFLQKNPKAAVYAAIRTAQLQTEPLPQNNLAVILHLAGYPQYALPVLEYLNTRIKSANLLNNIGQCYLSLGDKQKALQFFIGCLQANPAHAEANCGTAIIKIDEGKTEEAKTYVQQALKNGYSETLAQVAEQKKIALDYNALKCNVPEYFNPNKYKPVPAATKLGEVKSVLTQRQEMQLLYEAWDTKKEKVYQEQGDKIDKETLLQAGARIPGLFPNAPFGKKALFMVMQSGKEMAGTVYQDAINDNKDEKAVGAMHETLIKNIDRQIAERQPNSAYEACQIREEEVNKYLQKSAEFHDAKVRKTLQAAYDRANQQLYWYRFLLNADQYKVIFYHYAADLMKNLMRYERFQPLERPDYVATTCEKILQNPPKPQEVDLAPNGDCPVKYKIALIVGSFKTDCKGWELEGGEVAVVGIQKDYTTGEFTVAFGVGENLELPEIGVGAKGQAFFKFDRDFSPVDCGMILEAGGEAAAGPVMIAEEKINATIGMTSGINLSATHAGEQIKIFEYDPAK